jgi:hypothetical protein
VKQPIARFYLIVIFALTIGGIYANHKKDILGFVVQFQPIQELVSPLPVAYSTYAEKKDTTITIIDRYLESKNSPLFGQGKAFYEAAVVYNLDPHLLVAVAGVESTWGKYIKQGRVKREGSFNPFGWNHGYTCFASWSDAIWQVARKIANLPSYKTFRQTKKIRDFALAYNFPYAKSYEKKLTIFINELKAEELK